MVELKRVKTYVNSSDKFYKAESCANMAPEFIIDDRALLEPDETLTMPYIFNVDGFDCETTCNLVDDYTYNCISTNQYTEIKTGFIIILPVLPDTKETYKSLYWKQS
jgi:hypothetical protein